MVQLPQRRRPLEDDVVDVAFGACPLAPRRPPTRTDSTATPWVTELRRYGELGGAPTTGRLAGRLVRGFDTAGQIRVGADDLRGAPITLRRQVAADLTSAAGWATLVDATTVSAQNTAAAGLLDARSWPLDRLRKVMALGGTSADGRPLHEAADMAHAVAHEVVEHGLGFVLPAGSTREPFYGSVVQSDSDALNLLPPAAGDALFDAWTTLRSKQSPEYKDLHFTILYNERFGWVK